jgi:protocatechuate 3,4-dioxygenase beta subunit
MPVTLEAGRTFERGTSYQPVSSTKTDEEGRYRLPGLLPGDKYQVRINSPFPAISPGWKHQSPYVVALPDDAKDEFELDAMKLVRMDQKLSGQVIDPDGNPVAGATVSANMADGRRLSRFEDYPPPWDKSDENGRFQITHLPIESIRLMAYLPPKRGNTIEFPAHVTPELNEEDIRIILDPSLLEE